MTVRFACGHEQVVKADVKEPPQCQQCGERRVQRVTAPAPTFRGACSGPCAVK